MPALCLEDQHQAIFAYSKSNARRLGPPDRFREPVVASPTEQGVLRSKAALARFVVNELKSRPRVVIEAAHQAMVVLVGHSTRVESRAHSGKMFLGALVERIPDTGQRGDDGLVFRMLAIEHAQRVGQRSALAILAHA